MLRCDVITLFPEMVTPVLESSMLKRAREKGLLEVNVHNLREYTQDKHKVADDVPYGGGAGMVMMCEPLTNAIARSCSLSPTPSFSTSRKSSPAPPLARSWATWAPM